MTVSSLVGYFNNNLDIILLGRTFGDTIVGFYTRAQGMMSTPLEEILTPIMRVASPALAQLRSDPVRFRQISFQLIRVASFGGCLLLANAILTADWIVKLLLGGQWAHVTMIFRILAVFGFLGSLAFLLGAILIASGRPDAFAGWRITTTVLVVLFFFIGLRWNAIGVAACYALSGIITRIWLAFFVGKRVGIPGWQFLRACAAFILLAMTVSSGLFFLRRIWEPPGALAGIAVFAPLSTCLYVGCILCTSSGTHFLGESVRAAREILDGFRNRRLGFHRLTGAACDYAPRRRFWPRTLPSPALFF